MQDWIPRIAPGTGPKYLAIADALSRDIAAGKVLRGARLPSQRLLAARLGLDLTTITRAYREAQRLGLIEGNGRRGSFVRKGSPLSFRHGAKVERSDGMNTPPNGTSGRLQLEFRRSVEAVLARECEGLFHYQTPGGMSPARQAGELVMRGRNIPCSSENVLVTAGGQHALHAIVSAELKPGDVLAVGRYAYPGILSIARRFGVQLYVIEGDQEGLIPEALAAACLHSAIRAVYLVPTNDNPTTATMSGSRREALAEVISAHRLRVIEDDAYGLLPEQPTVAFANLVPDLTWHIASVSKVIAPGMRVAWLRAPDATSVWRLGADLHETNIMPSPINASVVADWVATGVFPELINEVRAEARARQEIARACLPRGSFSAHADGYHLWLELGSEVSPGQISDALRQQGVSATPGEAFASDRALDHRALRVAIGGTLSRDHLRSALTLLATLLHPDVMRKGMLV